MARFNGNAAYDLDIFAPKAQPKPKTRRRPLPQPEEPRVKSFQMVKIMLVSVVALALATTMIYGRVQMTELDNETYKIQEQLKIAKSEHTRLSMDLNSKVSLDRVEEYAVNVLGMRKIEKYQMEYIDVTMENKFQFLSPNKQPASMEDINGQLKEILEQTF